MPLLKKAARSIFFHAFLRDQPRIVVASTGRAGSTMLFDALADAFVRHRFGLDPAGVPGRLCRRLSIDFADRLATMHRRRAVLLKTHDLCEPPPAGGDRIVFVYGDPLDSALSVAQMVDKDGPSWFAQHQFHLRAEGRFDDLYRKDVLNYAGQLHSWLGQRRPGVRCVDYEDLWSEAEALSEFVGFPVRLPEKRPRSEKTRPSGIDEALFADLRALRQQLKSAYRKATS